MDDQCNLITKIAEDGLSALLIVPETMDRADLTPVLCSAILQRDGIELSAQTQQLITAFIEHAKAAPKGAYREVIAQGTPATHGEDGKILWNLPQPAPVASAPGNPTQATPDGGQHHEVPQAVNFYERSAYHVVKAGDVLGQLYTATPGTDGRDVRGKNIPARGGKACEFKRDESIAIDKNGKITAMVDGVLDRSGMLACIRDTIDVDEYVDFNTGNITFNGSIIVRKGVRDCFKVQAQGDVEVHGLIEAATIIAGRQLRALGGFAGRESGVAQVGGDLIAKYLDAIKADVHGNLCVEREVINCNTNVLGQINSPHGKIIGGQTHVAREVQVEELGADGLPVTKLFIGVAPQLDPLARELEVIVQKLTQSRQVMLDEQAQIKKHPAKVVGGNPLERLRELTHEIAGIQTQLERAEPTLEALHKKIEQLSCVDVKVGKRIYPNTVLNCGRFAYRVKEEIRGPLHITRDRRGRLMVEQDGKPATLINRFAELVEAA